VKERNYLTELHIFTMWGVWIARILAFFEGKYLDEYVVSSRIIAYFYKFHKDKLLCDNKVVCYSLPNLFETMLVGFFDGTVANGFCGVGFVLKFSHHFSMHAYFGGGKGTNTRDKIIALWGLLWLARKLKLDNLQVLGDSKVITSWASGMVNLQVLARD
jgi:hypothetical protein